VKLEIKHGVISTDDHLQEDRHLFVDRLPKKYRSLAPQVNRGDDGRDYWFVAGKKLRPVSRGIAAALEDRTQADSIVRIWEDVPKETYQPDARLRAMEFDGTDAQAFFPNISKVWSSAEFIDAETPAYRLACIQAYNDWVIDEWYNLSPRFIPQCLAPLWDVSLAVTEINRCAARGHRALMWLAAPEILGLPHFNESHWDPVYSACEEANMPLVFHIGPTTMLGREVWKGYNPAQLQAYVSMRAMLGNAELFGNLLFSGVLSRFPKLQCISIEAGLGWVPHLLETCDHQWEAGKLWEQGMPLKPSEYFRRQCAVNFWYEKITQEHLAAIGIDNILWEADAFHFTSAFPNSHDYIENNLASLPESDRRKILVDNAARFYRLDLL